MAFFDWEESFEVGVEIIDTHNKQFVGILNEAFVSRSYDGSLKRVLDRLLEYSKRHFAAEERWMAQQRHAELSLHSEEHGKFAGTIQGFLEDLEREKKGLHNELVQFLRNWLMHHILHEDAKFVRSLQDPGENAVRRRHAKA